MANPDYRQSGSGKESTYGRNLMNYIASKMPYSGYQPINPTDQLNPKYEDFAEVGTRRAEALARLSISQSNQYNNEGIGNFMGDDRFAEIMYAHVQKDKGARLRDYRIMAAFAEISNALDVICDETINVDSDGAVAHLEFRNDGTKLKSDVEEVLKKEFRKYINYFDLPVNGWSYVRDLLIEGETFWENIIHDDYKDKGILGVVRIPTELIDPVYSNVLNMMLKGFLYRKPIFDPNRPEKQDDFEFIPLDKSQVVYIHSGIWNENKTIRLPFIENARRAYRQLSLIEDAIVIYRLVRAPERLVFNVDVGNMAPPKAEGYLRKLIQQYWSSKTFDVGQGDITNKFNPQSMLDSFWFAKRAGSEGTSVTQLPGGQNLGQLDDLMYFVRKLYEALKVPVNRMDPESVVRDGSEILREELKFADFIIRLQQLMAGGIKEGFIAHLQFRNLWKKFKLREEHIRITFNVPTNYYELRENQKLELKVGNYNNLTSNEFVSQTFAQKKYLGWEDQDILANREFMRKDAEFEWERQQIMQFGPKWKEVLEQGAEAAEAQMSAAGAGGGPADLGVGGGGGGGEIPPEFGGAPPQPGPEGGAETPGAPPPPNTGEPEEAPPV